MKTIEKIIKPNKEKKTEQPPIVDLRKKTENPFVYNYYRRSKVLLNFPIDRGRLFVFPLDIKNNPIIHAVHREVMSPGCGQLRKYLEQYYEIFTPANIYELFNLDFSKYHGYSDIPAWGMPLPWRDYNIEEWMKGIQRSIALENKIEGNDIPIEYGFTWYGPVCKEKLVIEENRYIKTLYSIREKGYDEKFGFIKVEIFVDNSGEWRWSCINGLHRLACLVALGYTIIPAQISGVIYRDEVDAWPNILNRVYTPECALEIFDKLFHTKIEYTVK